jgi:HEAT repeat protein
MALMALAPLKELKLQETAVQALRNPSEEPLVKYGAVAVLKAADGIANCRVLMAAAATTDTTLRRLLADALGANSDDKAPDVIYQGLRSPDPNVRLVAARSLGTLKHEKAMDRLSEPLKDKAPEVRQAALEAVAERKDKRSEATLQREAQKSDEDSSAAAIALLPQYPSEETRKLLLKLAAHYKNSVAIPALDALGELRIPEALPVFDKAVKSKDWPVRVTAMRGLSKLKAKESVDLLVDRIAQEEGRMLAECADALRALTGKSFGYAPGAWKEWWTNNRETFLFPDAVAAATNAPGTTTYHGIPVLSTRMVFCVDISGSMTAEAAGGETRMEQAKRELSRTLGSLSKDATLNLIFFDDRIEPWHKQLVSVKQHLAVAQAIVKGLEPRGQTNIFDPLELAFQHKDVDTIYLLSDGEPSHGRVVEPGDILREVKRLNRLRQVVIHTISFGPSPFMKSLAEQNGGQYVEIR